MNSENLREDYQIPNISYQKRDCFSYQGKRYLLKPTIPEFLVEAGIRNPRIYRSIMRDLKVRNIVSLEVILTLPKAQMLHFENVNQEIANKLFTHAMKIKHRGPLIVTIDDLKQYEDEYYYLEFVKSIDNKLLKHAGGHTGIRSRSIVEICGPEDVGKTQWCLVLTCRMLQVGKKVLYVDTDNGFSSSRIKEISGPNNISQRSIQDNIIIARIDSLDELDLILDEISNKAENDNVGMVVIDSLMHLLQNTYPVDRDLNLLAERQLHLRKTMRRLKIIARNHNLIAVYTNFTRLDRYEIEKKLIDDKTEYKDDIQQILFLLKQLVRKEIPMGGNTLSQSSDIRIYLAPHPTNIDTYLCRVENCAYLPKMTTEYRITPMGIESILLDPIDPLQSIDNIDELLG
ncbi:MAG: hypothetical protein ACXAD7_23540 [Candidatus Kariarchaeaceae archaeon]